MYKRQIKDSETDFVSVKITGESIYNIHIEAESSFAESLNTLDILINLEESSETPDAKPKDGETVIDSDEFDDADFVWNLMVPKLPR